jgi:hypothetical protein
MDLYSSHLEYLQEAFKFKGKLNNVIEFGMGNYSTKLLIDNANNITSIEMQSEEWYEKIVSQFGNIKNWNHHKLIGPFEFKNIKYGYFDMAFVDGHGESRPECINLMLDIECPIIFAHDTEENGYGWDRVRENKDYNKITFKKHQNFTTLWTKDHALFNHMNNII